ncbi:MAG TPA: metal ABC transporter substrate-binding protein, partial [Nitrospiria bacterium]|nr:metal ABC transporter substrate-binding protein [Nitrospiria bacterium]
MIKIDRRIVHRLFWGCMGALLLLSFEARAQAEPPLKIVVTLPVLKDLTEQIGREHVVVRSLITELESEYTYSPTSNDILAVNEARIFFQIGIGLEVWVDGLIKNAGNKNLLVVTTGQGVPLLRDPGLEESGSNTPPLNRHRLGNPHIWLDPENAKTILRHITDGLIKVDSKSKRVYLHNQAEYLKKLDFLEAGLKQKTSKLIHRKIVTYDPSWPYFARRFGFEIAGSL